jgi:hypothetical protein
VVRGISETEIPLAHSDFEEKIKLHIAKGAVYLLIPMQPSANSATSIPDHTTPGARSIHITQLN